MKEFKGIVKSMPRELWLPLPFGFPYPKYQIPAWAWPEFDT
jgi:hypothetical protein